MAGTIGELVSRIPSAVIAVDDDLRILAASPAALEQLRLPTDQTIGRHCHDVLSLVDTPTGLPCRQRYSFAVPSLAQGWARSRTVELHRPDGRSVPIDCLFLTCTTTEGPPSTLCFLQQRPALTPGNHVPILQAVESVCSALSGATDEKGVLANSLKSVLGATPADGGELFRLDPNTDELVLQECQGLPRRTMGRFRRSVLTGRFPGSMVHSQLPLLATAPWPGKGPESISGLYLCAPILAEGRVLGAMALLSKQPDFDIAAAARILFVVAAQLGAYLRWACPPNDAPPKGRRGIPPVKGSRLRIYCLGPFQVVVNGQPIPASRFRRMRALRLLKCLVGRMGRPVSRETLLELLWPEADPTRTSGNLRVVLHALRRALEPGLAKGKASSFIVSQGGQLFLKPSNQVWVDADEFIHRSRRAANLASQDRTEAALAECRRAASLYRGDYMEDEPYGDWCILERDRLREVYINLMKQMASMLADRRDFEAAIDTCRTTLGVDRWREEVHRELILLLLKAGRRGEALRQYDACHSILQEELGVEPTQETEALRRVLLLRDHQ